MRTLIAVLLGAAVAAVFMLVMVHDATAVRQTPTRALFTYGSG
jgi:acid phosphatase family membrane protein YuiD